MSVLELYIEKDVVSGSMFHSANCVTSCENNLSNNESKPPRNVNNLHDDKDDDDDYFVSNSYVEESLDKDDNVDDISDTDDEVTNMIQLRIVHPTEGWCHSITWKQISGTTAHHATLSTKQIGGNTNITFAV
ncbi:hypothetical protein GmHk_14G040503 [Glycine max]|nr:hypothetical protein GmHk_14G040503 [Glycine max]